MARRRPRYSRIIRGQGAPGSRDRYLQYLAGIDNVSNVGNGRPRSGTIVIGLDPFGIGLTSAVEARGTVSADARAAIAVAAVAARINLTQGGSIRRLRLGNYLPARVVLTTGIQTSGVVRTSRTTGQRYLSYGGESNSHPFGKANDTDTYDAAVLAIETELLGDTTTGRRVSFVQEVVSG